MDSGNDLDHSLSESYLKKGYQMPDTAIKFDQQQRYNRYRASQRAQMICNLLRDFISQKCYCDAIDELTKYFDEHKVEFSTGEERKVYEALQKNMLDLGDSLKLRKNND